MRESTSEVFKQVFGCRICCCSICGSLGSLELTGSCRGVGPFSTHTDTNTHTHAENRGVRGGQVSGLMKLVYRRVFLLRREVYHVGCNKPDWKHMGSLHHCVCVSTHVKSPGTADGCLNVSQADRAPFSKIDKEKKITLKADEGEDEG